MGLRDKWADSREQDRQAREAYAAGERRYAKSEELRRMGVTSHWSTGALDPSLSEADLDAMIAAEKQRRAELYDTFMRVGTVITFRALGVQVLQGGDVVYTLGTHDRLTKTNSSRPLGLLAAAQAQVTDGTSAFSPGKALLVPLTIAPLASKQTADALITFTDGTVHMLPLDGSHAVREARKQCVQFNGMAGAVAPAPTVSEDPAADPVVRMRKLQELLDAGLISQQEFNEKRAAVIDGI